MYMKKETMNANERKFIKTNVNKNERDCVPWSCT